MSPWVRLDENAMEHPKVAGLSDGSFRLWVQGMAHCQKFLTDGKIDRVSLRGLRAFSPKRMADLIAARLWLSAEDDGIQVHDYLQWNDSREHVLKVRAQGRDRIRKLRGKECNAVTPTVTASEQSANDLRSYSGGVECSSQHDSLEEREGGLGETTRMDRVQSFIDWYSDKHEELFHVGYIGNPHSDYAAACRLVDKFTDVELREGAVFWFGQDDDFAKRGTRTIPKFASRASDCVLRAKRVVA